MPSVIDPNSTSYPIAAAADATGVPRALAYPYVWANRLWAQAPTGPNFQRLLATYEDLIIGVGLQPTVAFQQRVEAAIMDSRVYWPVPDWFTWPALVPERTIPDVVFSDDDNAIPPDQPEPVE
jgi:hypothetical protein